jgi:hypothetical protein
VPEVLTVLAIIGGLAVVLYVANRIVGQAFGVPLFCHLGLHRWRKVVAGRGRDARHVIQCMGCQVLKDES